MVNVHKRSKGVSDEVDFWHGENLDHAEKKRSKYLVADEMRGKVGKSERDAFNGA